MQGFLNVRTGDISGDIFLDGDIPGDIFWNEDFHAQDTLRVRRTGRFDAPTDKARKRPFLGGFDASRTETRRCVLGHRKREKTAL